MGFACMPNAVVKKKEQSGSIFGRWLLTLPTKPVNIDEEGYATKWFHGFLTRRKGEMNSLTEIIDGHCSKL